jgi:hypothetical protein
MSLNVSVESLKTWREEQFPQKLIEAYTSSSSRNHNNDNSNTTNNSNNTNTNNNDDNDTSSMSDITHDRDLEVGDIDVVDDEIASSLDSHHWLDDAPDPDFRLPAIPEATPIELAIAREAAAKVAAAEARARAAQAEEAHKAAVLAQAIASRAAGLTKVNVTHSSQLPACQDVNLMRLAMSMDK